MIVEIQETNSLDSIRDKLKDPVTFIESLMTFQGKPLQLFDYQKEIAYSGNWAEQQQRIAVCAARQVGKSITIAALLAYYAVTYPHLNILVLSRTIEQAGLVAKYAREFLYSSPLLSHLIDKKKSRKHDLVLTNGSIVFDRTTGPDSRNIRGLTLSGRGILVADEAAFIPSEAIKNILPASYGCTQVLVSTPYRMQGYFYDAMHSGEYQTYHVPASRCPRITSDEIESMRKLYRPSEFKNEVLAEFAQGADAVFDSASIERAIDHDLPLFDAESFDFDGRFPFYSDPSRTFIFSLDVSKVGRDAWVLTIGDLDRKQNTMQVVAYCVWAGTCHENENLNAILTDNPRKITADIMRFCEHFPARKVYVDATSNEYYADQLLHANLLPVEKFTFSTMSKERVIEHLSTCLRAEKLAIPNDEDFIAELMDFSYDVKRMETNLERRIYLSGNDDRVDSLAMLSQAITGEPISIGGIINAW